MELINPQKVLGTGSPQRILEIEVQQGTRKEIQQQGRLETRLENLQSPETKMVDQQNEIEMEEMKGRKEAGEEANLRTSTTTATEEEQPRKVKLKKLLKKVIVTGKGNQILSSSQPEVVNAEVLTQLPVEPEIRVVSDQIVSKVAQEEENLLLIERIKALVNSQLEGSQNKSQGKSYKSHEKKRI